MKKLKHVYSNCNQYAERDIEQLGDYYMVHIDAMTVESLHSKSCIAAELAFRDQRIAELESHIQSLKVINQYIDEGCPDISVVRSEIGEVISRAEGTYFAALKEKG